MPAPKINWKLWLGTTLVIILVAGIVPVPPAYAGTAVTIAYLIHAWAVFILGLGFWRWRERKLIRRLAAGCLFFQAFVFLIWAQWVHPASLPWATALFGVACMVASFALGLQLIRLVFSAPHPVPAIARALVDEAVRMKVAVGFLASLFIFIPLLPLALSARETLSNRLTFYLNISLLGASIFLSLFTIFLACGAICGDLEEKRVFLTLTKPVSRLQYLLGKWLGIMAIDFLLLLITAGGIYTYAQVARTSLPADHPERLQAQIDVLTARAVIYPTLPDDVSADDLYATRLAQLRKDDPVRFPPDQEPDSRTQEYLQNAVINAWQTVSPGEWRGFVFKGLEDIPPDSVLQLILRARASSPSADGRIVVGRKLNQGTEYQFVLPDNIAQTIELDADAIENGKLRIDIYNPNQNLAVIFTPPEGIQLLHAVGSFEGNFIRGALGLWIRLGFLAMLGLMVGTQVNFGVSILIALSITGVASLSGFFQQALQDYVKMPDNSLPWGSWLSAAWASFIQRLHDGEVLDAFKMILTLVGRTITTLLPSLSKYSFAEAVSDGRLVPWADLGMAMLTVGCFWTLLAGGTAWVMFKRRELARLTV